MPIPQFEQVHRVTNLGLSRFAMWIPILLRFGLLLLAVWYAIELFCNATGFWPMFFLAALGLLFLLVFVAVMADAYRKFLTSSANNAPTSSTATPLWPFLLMNVFMILLVSAIFKWERGRGAEDVTRGLLGFTWYWVQKIGVIFTGR